MNGRDWLQLAVYFAALCWLAPLLGRYLAAVLTGTTTRWMFPAKAVERWLYRLPDCRSPGV